MGTKLSRFCDGIIEAAWLAAVIVVPIFFNVYSSRIFEPDKIALLRTLALIIAAAWIVKIVEVRPKPPGAEQERRMRLRDWLHIPLLLPVAALAGVYLLSTLFSVTPRVTLWGSYQRLQGTYTTFSYLVIFAAMAANLRKRSQIERLITTIILASIPVSFYGILQRYQLDPIPWGGDVSQRIAANMGNSIFVAGYLIMVSPLTIQRILKSFRAILFDKEGLAVSMVRATAYVFIAAIQVIALYFTGSRGPWLGWMAGLFVMFILLSLYWQKRRILIGVLGLGFLLGAFLVVLNIPSGPLEGLRSNPSMGRLGHLLNAESDTGRVRVLIWQGAAQMFVSREPLEYPDGRKDPFSILRPLIGYGPESMYVAYNRFYQPELGQIESRNASPDRSHNETWDSLLTTGVLGLIAYLALFGSIFYYGLKWLGMVQGSRQRSLFWALYIGGGGLVALIFMVWRGAAYLGVSLPSGMVLGVIVYLIAFSLFGHYQVPESQEERNRALLLIGLLAVIVAHFIEINFGIAIVSTRLLFWIFAALLLLVGYVFPTFVDHKLGQEEEEESLVEKPERISPGLTRKKRRQVKTSTRGLLPSIPGWLSEAAWMGGILALLLVTLGYDFINIGQASGSTSATIWNSLTRLKSGSPVISLGVLLMFLMTWLAGGIIFSSESRLAQHISSWLRLLAAVLGISLLAGLVYWLWHASGLTVIYASTPGTMEEVLSKVGQYESVLTHFYAFLILLVLGLAAAFAFKVQAKMQPSSLLGSFLAPVLLVAALGLAAITNLRVIQANIAFKLADPFTSQGAWQVATEIYNRAIRLAPSEDYYYLFLGRAYLEDAKTLTSASERDQLFQQAERDLKNALVINPLNTDHTANLARLYSLWASYSDDPALRQQRGNTSDGYFSRAVKLSPNNTRIWDEWALLYLNTLQQPDEALVRLKHSLELDSTYDWTHALTAQYYLQKGKSSTDPQGQADAFNQAIAESREAIRLARDPQTKLDYMTTLAQIFMTVNQPQQAIATLQNAMSIAPAGAELWRYEQTVAQLYSQIGDKPQALEHANRALAMAPANQQATVQGLITQLQKMP